jgi:RNA polymerase sigma-70 factor (ECF subfamily)
MVRSSLPPRNREIDTSVSSDGSRTPDPIDDGALVALIVAGSGDAVAAAYDRHAAAVFATALRLLGDRQAAEDVVQETFLALWNRAETYDMRLGSLSTWLTTIARHRAVDRLRAAARRPRVISLAPAQDGQDGELEALERLISLGTDAETPRDLDPAASYDVVELRAMLARALAAMPPEERDVIALAYHEELTQTEIAVRLGWPLGTVKTRTRRGLRRLRETLREIAPDLGPATEATDGIG